MSPKCLTEIEKDKEKEKEIDKDKRNASEPVYSSENNISVSNDEINKYVGGKYE